MQGIATCRAGYCHLQGRVLQGRILPHAGQGIATGQSIATCRAGYCHMLGRVLPPAGQGITTWGRVLPPTGQGIATYRAGYCHTQGRVLPPAGQGIATGQSLSLIHI